MNMTCIHDLKPNRVVPTVEGVVARSYPLSMQFAKNRWIAFREIVLEDDSGWVAVKVWGPSALDVIRGQTIRLKNVYCFTKNERLYLTLSINSRLKICTQA
jgi:ssDNA-binding replication factor A large subunit